MNPHLVLAFWGVSFLLIAVPGPDWAFILGTGSRDRVVLPAVAGLMIGYSLLTGVVAAGAGAVVAHSPPFRIGLTVVGAAYLVHLGISLLRRPAALHGAGPPPTGSWVLRGIGVSGLNPKGLLIFLALLPQFADDHGRWPPPLQLGVLGLVFVATCGAFYTVVGCCARLVLAASPAASRHVSRFSGAAMVLVGLALLAERLR